MHIYTFMNKNVELFDVEMERGQAESLMNFREENAHLMPVFLLQRRGMGVTRRNFNDWWSGRRIPASRGGIKELLWKLENIGLDELAEKCLGLSLSDQFWIRPAPNVKWEDVNFFENDFSEDIGRLLMSGEWNGGSLSSPDNTSDGVVKKRWKIIDGVRCLIKGSSGPPWYAQPFREVFASKIAELLFAPFGDDLVVPYTLLQEEEIVYSVCPNFVTVETEYVSFNQINQSHKKPNHVSHYNFCKQFFGEQSYVLDLTLLLDYIVLNEDRHFGNFGIIRDTNTGAFLHPAPLFDTGSSLFFESQTISKNRIESKPFSKNFDTQLAMINISLYYDSISEVRKHYKDIFAEVFETNTEGEERKEKLLTIVSSQIENLLNPSGH